MENHSVTKQLLNLLKIFHDASMRTKLEYSIDGGTLLGAVRHKDIIPWDDDLDIMVLNTKPNHIALKSMFKYLNNKNISYVKNNYGYKLFFKDGKKIPANPWIEHIRKFKKQNPHVKGRSNISKKASTTYKKPKSKKKMYQPYTFPFLDILLVTLKKNRTRYNKNNWEKCFHTKDNLFPLKKYKINNLIVFGPNNPKGYLDSCYKNWETEAYKSYDHSNEKILKKIKMKI